MDERVLRLLDGDESQYPFALEKQYARVLNNIIQLWDTPGIKDYFFELLVDTRGGTRQGFPKEVARDIFNLSNIYDAREERRRRLKQDDAWSAVLEHEKQDAELAQGYTAIPLELVDLIESGDAEKVQQSLENGMDLESRDERSWTPLMISSFNGNEKLAMILICRGANIHARDRSGYTPLHWTAYNGFESVVDLLVREGADVNARSEYGWTPLMQAATRGHLIVVMRLIAGGAMVNDTSLDGWTALHKAAANGHDQIVKLLLSKGADVSIEYRDGTTAISLAEKNRHANIVKMLREAH